MVLYEEANPVAAWQPQQQTYTMGEEPPPPLERGLNGPPGLSAPRVIEAAPMEATKMNTPGDQQSFDAVKHGNGDSFMGSGGFPNPWLWPTDVASAGSGLPPSLVAMQAAQGLHPHDLPMKIPAPVPMSPISPMSWGNQREFYSNGQGRQPADALRSPAAAGGAAASEKALSTRASNESQSRDRNDFGQCRWHKSAETVGVISDEGHVFTKTAGPRRSRVSDRGARVELASICMVFDASLRCGGVHRYCYQIMGGELGAADGAGFVFDSKVRRNNIQRMRSVFLNQRGRICLRNNQQVTKLQAQLPPLTVGVVLTLLIDLDALMARFNVSDSQGVPGGSADVSLDGLFDLGLGSGQLRSGFFCAVVTGNITIGIH